MVNSCEFGNILDFDIWLGSVWEENELLVISNCAIEVPITGSWKMAVKTKHPVICFLEADF